MQRIYYPDIQDNIDEIQIKDSDIIHQLSKVLRTKLGDKIILFNGKEYKDYIFEISNIGKREIGVKKIDTIENNSEISFELSLFNALPNKLEKIEYIIQKGTEIGFTNFCFFRSDRSQKLHISPNKLQRLEKIIIEAAEQSGRTYIPKLEILEESVVNRDFSKQTNLFFHTKNEKSLGLSEIAFQESENINLFVGPEGGWSDQEVEILESKMKRVHLGDRILRTETTGIVTGFYVIHK